MSRLPQLLVLAGIAIVAVSVFADDLGIGADGAGGFGWKQAVGLGLGAVIAIAGAVIWTRDSRPT
jgi:hypothetical protein